LNVFAEMGSAWSNVMGDTVQSQHYIGKLLKYLGPDNIVWGTDCILGGSQQGQITLFRNFTITQEYQDKYGYPAITPATHAPGVASCVARANTSHSRPKTALRSRSYTAGSRYIDAGSVIASSVGTNRILELASLTDPVWHTWHFLTKIGSMSFSYKTGSFRLMATTGIG
jgi:hypothetical protein